VGVFPLTRLDLKLIGLLGQAVAVEQSILGLLNVLLPCRRIVMQAFSLSQRI
jgi:hypothetical protein